MGTNADLVLIDIKKKTQINLHRSYDGFFDVLLEGLNKTGFHTSIIEMAKALVDVKEGKDDKWFDGWIYMEDFCRKGELIKSQNPTERKIDGKISNFALFLKENGHWLAHDYSDDEDGNSIEWKFYDLIKKITGKDYSPNGLPAKPPDWLEVDGVNVCCSKCGGSKIRSEI